MSVTTEVIVKLLIIVRVLRRGECTIDGLTYMDPLSARPTEPGQNPCKSLYWYPRPIPEHCFYKAPQKPPSSPSQPIPMPIPIPLPAPMPPPMFIRPMPMYPVPPIIQPPMYPAPMYPPPLSPPMIPPMYPPPIPLPYGVPLAPTNPMIPVPGSYVGMRRRIGMVPGLPGLVSPNGGINIMPFSDAYSDLLEKHKQKMIRQRLEKVLDEYDGFPYKRHRPHKNCRRYQY